VGRALRATLIANVKLSVPHCSHISPLFGVKWKQWHDRKGANGEEPPDWAKELFALADEWKTLASGTDRWVEVGKKLIALNQENMTIIGTNGALPKPVTVRNALHNVFPGLADSMVHFNFGYMYPYRPDQWYKG
jgi:peptide/nickel transport system substrate-binding protein